MDRFSSSLSQKQIANADYIEPIQITEITQSNTIRINEDGSKFVNDALYLHNKRVRDISYFRSFQLYFQNVKIIDLAYNQICSIDDLKELRNIQRLNVKWNMIQRIEINTKEGQEEVFQKLKLFNCFAQKDENENYKRLKILKVNKLPNLEQFLASFNENVSEYFLKEVPRLTRLQLVEFLSALNRDEIHESLKGQNHRFIPSFADINLNLMGILNLSYNGLRSASFLQQGQSMSSLKWLDLRKNKLKELPQLLMASLRQLDLSQNRLKFMKEVSKLKCLNLQELYLSENSLNNLELFCNGFEGAELTHLQIESSPSVLTKWREEVFIQKRRKNPKILQKLTYLKISMKKPFKELLKKRIKKEQIIQKYR